MKGPDPEKVKSLFKRRGGLVIALTCDITVLANRGNICQKKKKKVVIYLLFCHAFGICSLVGRRKTVHKFDKNIPLLPNGLIFSEGKFLVSDQMKIPLDKFPKIIIWKKLYCLRN